MKRNLRSGEHHRHVFPWKKPFLLWWCMATFPATTRAATTDGRPSSISTSQSTVKAMPATTSNQNQQDRTAIFAESALVDKETGRIFWEGGARSTLTQSLETRFTSLVYVKSLLASLFLWTVLYGWIAAGIKHQLQQKAAYSWIQGWQRRAPLPVAIGHFILALGGFVPRVPVWVLLLVVVLYLAEAYFSSTHQFLAHRSDCHNVETLMEQLRQEIPVVQWKVRVFQLEPLWPSLWQDLQRCWRKLRATYKGNETELELASLTQSQPLLSSSSSSASSFLGLTRKRILRQATGAFMWPIQGERRGQNDSNGWKDGTTAGIWTRARAATIKSAPLAKIHLAQVVVLGTRQAREEYFRQQAQFVQEHTASPSETAATSSLLPVAAEFATHMEVPGYQSRVLVTRKTQWWCSRRIFWLVTLLGCSVLYRAWMARQCDVIRVSLVKETLVPQTNTRSWWLGGGQSQNGRKQEPCEESFGNGSSDSPTALAFRSVMQQLEVYSPHSVVSANNPSEPALDLATDISHTDAGLVSVASENMDKNRTKTTDFNAPDESFVVANVTLTTSGGTSSETTARFEEVVSADADKPKSDDITLNVTNAEDISPEIDEKEESAAEENSTSNGSDELLPPKEDDCLQNDAPELQHKHAEERQDDT